MSGKGIIVGALIFILLPVYLILVPSRPSYLAYGVGALCALVLLVHYLVTVKTRKKQIGRTAFRITLFSVCLLFVLLPGVFAAALYRWGIFSPVTWILLISLTISFYYSFLTVPLAVYHRHRELKEPDGPYYYPSMTVLIPAYNEEKVLDRTLETVLEAPYPDKEIIVINDGSTDGTSRIAGSYSGRGVKVIDRPNGGKAVALNHGLSFARGEIVIVVDADSMVGRNALIELVQPFRDPEVAAVAGNIKVGNRKNLLTGCQALEYIASINVYRRALDVFGSVTVVPGALGAYRREVLEDSGFYDPDTLVEDFDMTVKALKSGRVVQARSTAVSYTEAPQTLGELIKQRQRWYRGNFQALWKHRDALFNPRYGFLQKLAFPYMIISMIFMPFAGLFTLASVALMLANGDGLTLLPPLLFFSILQFLLSILAVQLDGEDMKMALYYPLFILGYKQLCDYVIIKCLFDVLFRKNLKWTNVRRTGAEVSRGALS
jgi:cellulose synthase/poly-beta-1,6-N-acetylglucosamine synthase-like glycosyltransferase